MVVVSGAGQEQSSQAFGEKTQATSRIRVVATYFIDTQQHRRRDVTTPKHYTTTTIWAYCPPTPRRIQDSYNHIKSLY